jgi:site-specific recombinase XerD
MSTKHPSLGDQRGNPLAELAPHLAAFEQHLRERGHAHGYIAVCKRSVAHLSSWLRQEHRRVGDIDEALVDEFVDEHLPRCTCGGYPRDRRTVHAALRHLLRVLRGAGAIAGKAIDVTPVGEELRRYEQYMAQVRGLAASTRESALRIVGRLLRQRFGNSIVDLAEIKPGHMRRFYAQQAKLYKAPASVGAVVTSLRGYLRWRATLGDRVHALLGALPYPANWRQASLPKSLKPEEIAQLVASFGRMSPSHYRADAMMRCALDLGLRVGEVTRLSLDDIDWREATITLRRTKGRREDLLPLPATTGQAIAAYLRHGRPMVRHRIVFARHVTPREQPLTAAAVRTIIRRAFARAGLPHTRSHLLRHTMAARLLQGGASLKEVADVLRHRSLNTTLIYAKLDSRSLIEVALPWPGTPTALAAGSHS